jgi:hypothetical protein
MSMLGGILLEYTRNEDVVRLLIKMKDIKKNIIDISSYIKSIKVVKGSTDNYIQAFNTYQEASCYFFQCCGFLKSQYFGDCISPSSKKFFITNLFIPAYRKFLELRQILSTLDVDKIYECSLQTLKKNVEHINSSLSDLLSKVGNI